MLNASPVKSTRGGKPSSIPKLAVYGKGGQFVFNAAARKEFALDDFEYALLSYDSVRGNVRLRLTKHETEGAHRLHKRKEYISIHATNFANRFHLSDKFSSAITLDTASGVALVEVHPEVKEKAVPKPKAVKPKAAPASEAKPEPPASLEVPDLQKALERAVAAGVKAALEQLVEEARTILSKL